MTVELCAASSLPCSDQIIEKISPSVHEAGNPYFDFIFGGHESAAAALARWMKRASSEISIERVFCLTLEGQTLGGFIAMPGAELAACRRLDAAALTMSGNRERRELISQRLELTSDLFPAVGEAEFYLSKMWVDPDHQGAGYASVLMEHYLCAGRRRGFTQFRLDVCADNDRAIRIYRRFGFQELRECSAPEAGLRYLAMAAQQSTE
jgi:ribosomal protein S18 acetylase RimI-like enzyme